MSNYEDIKVGDKMFYSKNVGVNHWGDLHYSRSFFIECLVTKVTKTQFTTKSGRYRKSDGHCVGGGHTIHRLGEKNKWAQGGEKTATRCERIECSDYDNELQQIRDAQYLDLGRFIITKIKGIERAQKAASLMMQLQEIMELSK